jgi:tetratricopeptide (TPR) repeat protein
MNSILLNKANEYYKKGNYQKALESYQAILNRYRDDPIIRERLAMCYYELGQMENARREYELVIKLKKETIDSYRFLGLIYEKENRLDEAEKTLSERLKSHVLANLRTINRIIAM